MATTFPTWVLESDAWKADVVYLLDDALRFVDCNPVWDAFAAENGGHGIFRSELQGRLILEFVPEVLRTFYVHKFWLARRTPGWTHFRYDCSSPEKIRLFRMAMMPIDDTLLITNHLRLEETCQVRPPLTAEQLSRYVAASGLASMCANCRKTKRLDDELQWDWIPEMLKHDSSRVSHGLCPRCATYLYG